MKIGGGAGAPSGPSRTGGSAPAGTAGGFAPAGAAGSVRGAAPASAASGAGLVGGLGALLALQDVGGPLERRRRAVARGGRLLDDLDRVKLALLDGGDPADALHALSRACAEARERGDDPGLDGVLDEIDLRAAVELAKAEVGRAA